MSDNGAKPPSITIESVTPHMASTMLGTMAGNRGLRNRVVQRYAREMVSGAWLLNGEAIKIDRRGKLIDGQHRLNAVVIAKIPVKMLIVRGVDESAMMTLDTGVGRSFADAATIAGKDYPRNAGAIARLWDAYDNGVARRGVNPSHQEIERVMQAHPTIIDSAIFVRKFSALKSCLPTVQAFVHAYASEKYDREMADTFTQCLAEGANLSKTDPIYVLRRRLVDGAAGAGRRFDSAYVLALTIKAWNAWIAGEQIQTLVFRAGGDSPEDFPKFAVDAAPTKTQRRSAVTRKQRLAGAHA